MATLQRDNAANGKKEYAISQMNLAGAAIENDKNDLELELNEEEQRQKKLEQMIEDEEYNQRQLEEDYMAYIYIIICIIVRFPNCQSHSMY